MNSEQPNGRWLDGCKLMLAYLKSKWRSIAVFLFCAAILAAVVALFRLPLAAVGYAFLVCLFFCILFLCIDFLSFYRKHRVLQKMQGSIMDSLADLPPSGSNIIERDYQQLLVVLAEDRARLVEQLDSRYKGLTEYYSIWAHHIKTPIAAMRLLLQSSFRENNRELLEELQRIEQYVGMVMTYLRLDAETTDYVFREVELERLVRQAVKTYASSFIRRKISLQLLPISARVLTDEKWLLFVLEQVLSNALKYTPEGGSVTIRMKEEMTLCISDTGVGIAKEDLPRIFEKGFTGLNGRYEQKASGIGLYLCSRICKNLGHTICVESVLGKGTTVCIGLAGRRLWLE